jgi:hypothetical protein
VGPSLVTGTPGELLSGVAPFSDPFAASAVLQQQASAAAAIIGGAPACDDALKPAEQAGKGLSSAGDTGKLILERAGRAGGRLGHKAGVLGPGAGVIGEAFALRGNYNKMAKSLDTAFGQNATSEDKVRAVGDTAEFTSGGLSLVRDAAELPVAYLEGSARRQAKAAFRQAAPNASRSVVNRCLADGRRGSYERGRGQGRQAGHHRSRHENGSEGRRNFGQGGWSGRANGGQTGFKGRR